MNDGVIKNNTAGYSGGGVYIGGGTFAMSDGVITGNIATASGGGLYITGSSTIFTMSGGFIYGVDAPVGSVSNSATSGAAVSVNGGTAQYDGNYKDKGYGSGNDGNTITTTGNTLPLQPLLNPVAKIGGTNYATLATAIESVSASGTSVTAPTEIIILRDITMPEAGMSSNGYSISTGKNIKLMPETGKNRVIIASAGGYSLFTVASGASLNLDGSDGSLTLNGKNETAASGRRGVYINGGTFIMNDGVTITGFKNSSTGGGVYVYNSGTFTMAGGVIVGSTASTGGGVYVYSGNFTMEGGTIYGADAPVGFASNTASSTSMPNGAAVYVSGGTAKYGGDYGTGVIVTTGNTLPPLSPAAKVNATGYLYGYSTLSEAIAAAPTGTLASPMVITLLRDITVPERGMSSSSGYTISKHLQLMPAT